VISTSIVSPNYFASLGVRPFLGRMLEAADPKITSDIPVVISYQFWKSEYTSMTPHSLERRHRPAQVYGAALLS
jgi:hypothetical protein